MEPQNIAAAYGRMSVPDLMRVAQDYDLLSPNAQECLRQEFRERQLKPPRLREAKGDGVDRRNLVTVRRVSSLVEAAGLQSVLESAGIFFFLCDENTARTYGVSGFLLLEGMRLQVAAEDLEEAGRILSEPVPKEFQLEDGSVYEQPFCADCGSIDMTLGAPPVVGVWRCNGCGARWVEDAE